MEMKVRNTLLPSDNKKNDQVYKIIVVGDSGAGKSQLVARFMDNTFSVDSEPTVMMDCMLKNLENSDIRLHVWDLAGREAFSSTTSHYKEAQGALVVYDITKVRSFEHATQWFERIRETLGDNCVIMLVGNKLDMRHQRSITSEEGRSLAQRFEASFIEASACDATNVGECFMSLIEKITEKIARQDSEKIPELEQTPGYESTPLTEEKRETDEKPKKIKLKPPEASSTEIKRKKKNTCKFPCCF